MGACQHSILPELLDHPCPVACSVISTYCESVVPISGLKNQRGGVGIHRKSSASKNKAKERRREREEGEKGKGTSCLLHL